MSSSTASASNEARVVSMSGSDRNANARRFRVGTCADWEDVAAATSDFHDAVVREVALVGDEYLDSDYILRMTAEVGATVRLLVHIQRRDVPAAELTFVGVQQLVYNGAEQVDPARCSASRDGFLTFELASVAVKARSCEVSLLDASALGERMRLEELSGDES
jgi:hypothetical protein